MLLLGRTVDESIEIDIPPSDRPRKLKVMVCGIRNGRTKESRTVRIGISADKDVKILRSELKWRDSDGL